MHRIARKKINTKHFSGSTISTLLHDKINPKNCQVLSLGDTGFLQFFRVVSRDYGKPRFFFACFFGGFAAKLSWAAAKKKLFENEANATLTNKI